ncbi:hypothetical protein H7X65_01875 [Candidatus Parcubacteria bacterium]|nr:hypothetical protein [Candidatus Parcubacteria bacterium]
MKKTNQGFIVPLLMVIIGVLVVGGGFYIYYKNESLKKLETEDLQMVATSTISSEDNKENLKTKSSVDIKYKMVSTVNSKYQYPQITDFKDKQIMDKVNQTLSQTFNFSCDIDTPTDKSYWDVKISIDYAKNDIFSVNSSGDFYCGGAYPTNNYSNTLTFDMKTGEQVSFENMFDNYQKNKVKIINSMYEKVISETKDYISKNPTDNGNCGSVNTYDMLASEYGQSFRLTDKPGVISIRPDYPHVIEACIPEVEVAVQKLLPYVSLNSILNRI